MPILLVPVLIGFLLLKVRSGMPLRDAGVWAVLGIYVLWTADLLFFPWYIDAQLRANDPYLVNGAAHWVNLVPFGTIGEQIASGSFSAMRQVRGNIGLLLPLGLLGPIVMSPLRRFGRLVLAAVAVSVSIELIQSVGTLSRLMRRSVDIDDVILNVAGAILGWLVWKVLSAIAERVRAQGSDATST